MYVEGYYELCIAIPKTSFFGKLFGMESEISITKLDEEKLHKYLTLFYNSEFEKIHQAKRFQNI